MKNITALWSVTIVLALGTSQAVGQYVWAKDTRNPIFTGVDGTWSTHVFNPCVLFNSDSSRYEMWFCATSGPTADPTWRPYSIGRAVSNDGIHWAMSPSPVLAPEAGAWDSFTTDIPHVLRENGQYKMWYSSYKGGTSPGYLGYATSPDGIHWEKYQGNPVFGPGTAAWEAIGPYSCYVVPKRGGYKMWYDAYAYDSSLSIMTAEIGYAESSDGINWIRDTVNNPVLRVGSPGQWDDMNVFHPHVVGIRDSLYMWYVGSRGGTGGWTGLAVSIDGLAWTKCGTNPILVQTAGVWDEDRACAGTVLRVDSILHMWYEGWRSPHTSYQYSIGHATSLITEISGSAPGEPQEVPRQFMLEQNYPNPFNPSTTIRYQIPKSSVVRLIVFDLLGREVSVLVSQKTDAGIHDVKFDGTGLSSGVYFYQLRAGDFVQTKKLQLTR